MCDTKVQIRSAIYIDNVITAYLPYQQEERIFRLTQKNNTGCPNVTSDVVVKAVT